MLESFLHTEFESIRLISSVQIPRSNSRVSSFESLRGVYSLPVTKDVDESTVISTAKFIVWRLGKQSRNMLLTFSAIASTGSNDIVMALVGVGAVPQGRALHGYLCLKGNER